MARLRALGPWDAIDFYIYYINGITSHRHHQAKDQWQTIIMQTIRHQHNVATSLNNGIGISTKSTHSDMKDNSFFVMLL
jgi:hypothetical protein